MNVALHVSVNWHTNIGLSTHELDLSDKWPEGKIPVTLNQSLWGNSSSFSRPRLAEPVTPVLKEGNLKYLHLRISTQGSWRIKRETLLPLLTILDTTIKQAVALVNPQITATKRDTACAYLPVICAPEISQILSQ